MRLKIIYKIVKIKNYKIVLKVSDFNYHLPPELIATQPSKVRDQSRLLVLDKKTGQTEHQHFFDLVDYLEPGDLLVANNSKVIPARLIGKKNTLSALLGTGGEVEVFLSKQLENVWECLIKGRVKVGTSIVFSKKLSGEVMALKDDGVRFVKFNLEGTAFVKEVEKIGQVPLPPYIVKKRREEKELPNDKKNYQTVYADNFKKGSVAAPTAGLHFTPELIKKIKAKGVGVEYLTLHVGLGTFLPVKTEKIEEHKIHSEYAEVSAEVIKKIVETKKRGGRIIAIGTTTTRTLEYVLKNLDIQNSKFKIQNYSGWVDIFIYPPYKFKVVDALITNFHLPKSTLLMLVSAFAACPEHSRRGKKYIDKAYQEAIKAKYRFYSYGDAMLIK